MFDGSTHLTPAQAGRLLGRSPARVREMIRHGELTQELIGGLWLIPLRDINRISNPSSEPKDRRSDLNKKRQEKLAESTSPGSPHGIGKAPPTKNTHDDEDLAAKIERLDGRMKQLDAEVRDLSSGLMNDEKRERIEELKTEKSKLVKNLQKLRRGFSGRDR
jgi:uncharacterized coiled-coil DUF342 family protein